MRSVCAREGTKHGDNKNARELRLGPVSAAGGPGTAADPHGAGEHGYTQYPAEVAHGYEDKYGLAEFLTNTALAGQLNALEAVGLTEARLAGLAGWVREGGSVTLRLRAEERCKFERRRRGRWRAGRST